MPKTAGIYVETYLQDILKKNGYKHHSLTITNSPRFEDKHKGFDWTEEELLEIAKCPKRHQFVSNHSPNWSLKAFREFKKRGWFTFAFVRHPGDQICSLYFFSRERYNLYTNISLDNYVRSLLKGKDTCWLLPTFWEEIDFIREYTEENFAYFLNHYFQHKYLPGPKLNSSANKGYKYYCETKEISAKTKDLLENSEQYGLYIKIKSL